MLVMVLSVGFVMRQELSRGIRKQGLKDRAGVPPSSAGVSPLADRGERFADAGEPSWNSLPRRQRPGEALLAPASGLRYEPPVDQGMGFAGIPGEPGCFFDEKTVVGETEAIARLRLQLDGAYQPNKASTRV